MEIEIIRPLFRLYRIEDTLNIIKKYLDRHNYNTIIIHEDSITFREKYDFLIISGTLNISDSYEKILCHKLKEKIIDNYIITTRYRNDILYNKKWDIKAKIRIWKSWKKISVKCNLDQFKY